MRNWNRDTQPSRFNRISCFFLSIALLLCLTPQVPIGAQPDELNPQTLPTRSSAQGSQPSNSKAGEQPATTRSTQPQTAELATPAPAQTASSSDEGPAPLSLEQTPTFQAPSIRKDFDLSQLQSTSVIVLEVGANGTLQTLLEKNADTLFEPATTTKLYTALLAFDRLQNRLQERVKLQDSDFEGLAGARMVGFVPGEEVPILDLFYGVIIESGGEAARALARLSYGGEEEFVAAMKNHAAKLGLQNSVFSNSTGLSVPGDQTQVRDLATILALAASRPLLARMMMTATYTSAKTQAHPDGITMHSILFQDVAQSRQSQPNEPIYIQGGRPGWSPNGAFTLTGFAKIGRKLLISATAGAPSAEARFADQVLLYKQLLSQTHEVLVFKPGEELAQIPLQNGNDTYISLRAPDESVKLQVPSLMEAEDLIRTFDLPQSLEAPVAQGTQLGTLQISVGGSVLYTQTFTAQQQYDRKSFHQISASVQGFYNQHPILFILLFLVLILAVLACILYLDLRKQKRLLASEKRAHEEAVAAQKAAERARQEERWKEHQAHTYTTGFSRSQSGYSTRGTQRFEPLDPGGKDSDKHRWN